jgi:hypothetical protein
MVDFYIHLCVNDLIRGVADLPGDGNLSRDGNPHRVGNLPENGNPHKDGNLPGNGNPHRVSNPIEDGILYAVGNPMEVGIRLGNDTLPPAPTNHPLFY